MNWVQILLNIRSHPSILDDRSAFKCSFTSIIHLRWIIKFQWGDVRLPNYLEVRIINKLQVDFNLHEKYVKEKKRNWYQDVYYIFEFYLKWNWKHDDTHLRRTKSRCWESAIEKMELRKLNHWWRCRRYHTTQYQPVKLN